MRWGRERSAALPAGRQADRMRPPFRHRGAPCGPTASAFSIPTAPGAAASTGNCQQALLARDRGYDVSVVAGNGSELARSLRGEPGIRLFEQPLGSLSFLNPARMARLAAFFRAEAVEAVVLCLPRDVKAGGVAAKLAGVPADHLPSGHRRARARPLAQPPALLARAHGAHRQFRGHAALRPGRKPEPHRPGARPPRVQRLRRGRIRRPTGHAPRAPAARANCSSARPDGSRSRRASACSSTPRPCSRPRANASACSSPGPASWRNGSRPRRASAAWRTWWSFWASSRT